MYIYLYIFKKSNSLLVKTEISKMNRNEILQNMKGYKKIDIKDHLNEPFRVQPYLRSLNISEARLKFKIKTCMTPTIRMNFPSDRAFAKELWTCTGCTSTMTGSEVVGKRDTQSHVMICPGYEDFRENMNLDEDRDLVKYFSKVIKSRLELELDD